MYGGGTSGGTTTQSFGSGGGGGTQTAGGAGGNNNAGTFGQGGQGLSASGGYGGAGGGGWYGGGGSYPDYSGDDDRGGGGGSGYVYTSSTASNYPSGCLLNSSYYLTNAQTVAGNTAFTSPTGTNETGHTGNGYIRITVIKAGSGNTLVKIDSTTWKNYKNMFVKTPTILPSGYTQLEYLQSSGTQYINTNMFYTHVKATYEIMSVGSTYIAIFGSRTSSSSSNQFAFGYAAHQSPKLWRFDYEIGQQALDPLTVGTELPWDGKHTISIDSNNGSILIDNNLINLGFPASIEASNVLPLYLFALNTNGTAGEIGNTRIYSFKLYDTNFNFMMEKPVLNLVPARNSLGVLGMYDTIGGKFYTNAGTGTFTAGPNINPWKPVKGVWTKTTADTWSQAL